MSLIIECPSCHKQQTLSDDKARQFSGRRAKCGKCGGVVAVPIHPAPEIRAVAPWPAPSIRSGVDEYAMPPANGPAQWTRPVEPNGLNSMDSSATYAPESVEPMAALGEPPIYGSTPATQIPVGIPAEPRYEPWMPEEQADRASLASIASQHPLPTFSAFLNAVAGQLGKATVMFCAWFALLGIVWVLGFVFGIPGFAAVSHFVSPRWEYKIVSPSDSQFIEDSNALGNAGWEVISAAPSNRDIRQSEL